MDGKRKNVVKPLDDFNTDRYLAIVIISMITLLIGINASRIYNEYTLVNRNEFSKSYELENIPYDSETIILSIDGNSKYPLLEIIINGELIDVFGDNSQVKVNVTDGSVVQVNGSMYKDTIGVSIKNSSLSTTNYIGSSQVLVKENIRTLAIIKM